MITTRTLAVGAAAVAATLLGTSATSAQCYVDSVAGNDSNDGASEAAPVRSQSAIPTGCTEVRYARGSLFNEAVNVGNGFGGGGPNKFTNYGDASKPLPKFVVQSGSVVSSFGGGITVDGLYLAGSTGDGTMANLIQGVCVMMGGGSQLLNSEITDCDIGIMLSGEGSLVQGNTIHDLKMAVDSTNTDIYANAVGGAEGIFINGSNNEIAYNTFYNCADAADWVSGNCDGGATEVTVSSGGVVENVRIHHNLSLDTCGFFEVSGAGVFRNSEFYYNVMIDSGWMMLLQVNETTLENITWTNNTAVHHAVPANSTISPSVTMIYRAEVTPGTVFMNNNLIAFESAGSFMATIDGNIDQSNNLLLTGTDPGFVNMAGKTATDFDLVAGSLAIDAGSATVYTADFLNRSVPAGAAPDVGAFEYGAGDGTGGSAPSVVPSEGTGGASGTDGTVTLLCSDPLRICNEVCVDVASDAANCGECASSCEPDEFCSIGNCQSECGVGLSVCGQSCVDFAADILHCGGCDTTCMVGQRCAAGECVGEPTGGDPTLPTSSPVGRPVGANADGGCACATAGTPGRASLGLLGLLGLVASCWMLRRRRD